MELILSKMGKYSSFDLLNDPFIFILVHAFVSENDSVSIQVKANNKDCNIVYCD